MAESPAKPRRRWFRFSLRTMLVIVTVLCVGLALQFNWIRQRREVLRRQTETVWSGDARRPLPTEKPSWRFDLSWEEPVAKIFFGEGLPESEFRRIQALFPEADVVRSPDDESDKYYVFP